MVHVMNLKDLNLLTSFDQDDENWLFLEISTFIDLQKIETRLVVTYRIP
jgi:hypothetical protein